VRQSPAAAAARLAYCRALRRRAIRQQDIHHPNIIGSVVRAGIVLPGAARGMAPLLTGTSGQAPTAAGAADTPAWRGDTSMNERWLSWEVRCDSKTTLG